MVFSELNILNLSISQGNILQHRVKKCRCFFYLFMFIIFGGEGKMCGTFCVRYNINHFTCITFINAHSISIGKVF